MNHYLIPRPSIISFSGGRTSGFMLKQIIDAYGGSLPEDVVPVFANTGLEHRATYDFISNITNRWCKVVVVERGGPRDEPNVVDISSCSKKGEPFTELNKQKKFLPNPVARICTSHLKVKVIANYAKSLGWDSWSVAIGLRADEPRRVARLTPEGWSESYDRIAPMAMAGHGISDVSEFWSKQDFDLKFPAGDNLYGNCVGCFLKSRLRLETIARKDPDEMAWWVNEESRMKATFRSDRPNYATLLASAKSQPILFGQDDDSLPCDCTG